jgi:hypothetical protein
MRLTATDPVGGTGLMGVKGMEELGAGAVDNKFDGGKGRLWTMISAEHNWRDSYLLTASHLL